MNFLYITLPLYVLIFSYLLSPQDFNSFNIDTQLEYIYKEHGLMLEGHSHSILSIVVHDSKVYTGSKDRTIRIWDQISGQQLQILYGHKTGVNHLMISQEQNLLISGSWDGSIIFWNLDNNLKIKELKAHYDWVTDLKLSPGPTLYSIGNDGILNTINLNSLNLVKSCKVNSGFIWSLDISSDSKYAVVGAADKNVTVWTLDGCEKILEFKAHKNQINFVGFFDAGRKIVTSGRDDGIMVWESRSGEFIERVDKLVRNKYLKKFDDDKVIVVSRENEVVVWNIDKRTVENRMAIMADNDLVMKFHLVKEEGLWYARDYFVSLLNFTTETNTKVTQNLPVLAELKLDHSSQILQCKTENGQVHLWNISSSSLIQIVYSAEEASSLDELYPGLYSLFTKELK